MNTPESFVLFALDACRYALSLAVVERVVPALELTPLPGAPGIVLGVFNLQGRIIPTMNLRRRLERPERDVQLTDQFLVAAIGGRPVALVVDATLGIVRKSAEELVPVESFLGELPQVRGILRLADGLVLIQDLARFLSLDEAAQLDGALRGGQPS